VSFCFRSYRVAIFLQWNYITVLYLYSSANNDLIDKLMVRMVGVLSVRSCSSLLSRVCWCSDCVLRELFRISISNYQDWFKVAVIFWLQTFREECMRRMEKALEIEKDVSLVSSLFNCQNNFDLADSVQCGYNERLTWDWFMLRVRATYHEPLETELLPMSY